MNFKALISSVVIGSLTLASAIPITTYQVAVTNERVTNKYSDAYDVSFKEIIKVSCYVFKSNEYNIIRIWVYKDKILGPSGLPDVFWDYDSWKGEKSKILEFNKEDVNVFNSVLSFYNISWERDSMETIKEKIENVAIINVSMKIEYNSVIIPNQFFVKFFSAQLKPKPPKDNISLPDNTTDFSGTYKYGDIIKNLDYLMIKRKDFDKFDYSYLYWVPIFNFLYETQMDRRTSITVLIKWISKIFKFFRYY